MRYNVEQLRAPLYMLTPGSYWVTSILIVLPAVRYEPRHLRTYQVTCQTVNHYAIWDGLHAIALLIMVVGFTTAKVR